MRLRVVWIGKTRNPAARQWSDEYLLRIGRFAKVRAEELTEKQGEAALLKRAQGARLVLVDPAGKQLDSSQFAAFLEQQFERDTRELVLAIGGAEGFSASARGQANALLSLSPLTFSHELARVALLEQIYRACTILNHHPYAR
jgi:23S rRNA (pseudouridine1915-N3)-methyltransferase